LIASTLWQPIEANSTIDACLRSTWDQCRKIFKRPSLNYKI